MNTPLRRKALAAAVAGTLILAVCGDDDDDDAATTDAATTDEAGATDTTAGGAATTAGGATETTGASGGSETTTGGTGSGGGGGAVELAGGEVFVTGSSTVEPISTRVGELALEQSGGELEVTVEGPGTGDGFATFCGGGADVADASRPINDEEIALVRGRRRRVRRAGGRHRRSHRGDEPGERRDHVPRRARPVRPGRPRVRGSRQLERRDRPGDRGRVGQRRRLPGRSRSTSPVPARSPGRTTRSSSSPSAISPRSVARTR